jgi:hypothetical protein
VYANAISRPHALVVLWAQVLIRIVNGCGSMLSGSVRLPLGCPRSGGLCFSRGTCGTTSFWSALHDFARHDRPVPAKGWDEVGPDHPFLSVRIQVPLCRA